MKKRFAIGLMGFVAGVAGNFVAGWLQDGKWWIALTSWRLAGTLIGVVLILFIVAWLESEHALAWNWCWHRFWYLRELLKNSNLRHWETDFARLEMVQGRRKIFGADVFAKSKRQDMGKALHELIIRNLRELLKNLDIRLRGIKFANPEMVQGKRKIFGAEVIAEGKRQDMIEVLRELITRCHERSCRALVLGEPGSGKTTGLERLTLDLARAGARRLGIACKMPVLVRLGNFQQGKLLDYVAQTMRHGTKRSSGKVLSQGIEKLMAQGHVVLLCDALDEALGERRELVLAELADLLESRVYQNVPVIITSRTREDPGGRLKGLTVFEIQDLSDAAVNVFIGAYKRPEHSDAEITERLRALRLLEPRGLGRNPFWLRLVVASGAFEGNKGQILKTSVDTLLAREWDKPHVLARSWRRVLPRDEQLVETKRSLAWLGYSMSIDNVVTLEKDRALKRLTEWLKRREQAGIHGLSSQDVLGLGRDAQVLVYDPGPIKFRHRLLQEFMTAWMLMLHEKLRDKEIEQYTQDKTWWETLFLLGGLLGANSSSQAYNRLVQRVLGDGTNDQCLFAAIGLLRSVKVENRPTELANSIMAVFNNLVALSKGLTDNQFSALQELGRILGDAATEIFEILFRSPIRLAKDQGARLLCNIHGRSANKILLAALGDEKQRHTTTTILVSIGEEAVETLMMSLRDSEFCMHRNVEDTRHRIQADALYINAANDLHRNTANALQRNAAEALGKIGKPAVLSLITALRDSDSNVRSIAAEILGRIGDARAVEPLITALRDSDSNVRICVLKALGEIGDASAVKPLLKALRKVSDVDIVAEALGKIGDPRAVEPLINLLSSDSQMSLISLISKKINLPFSETIIRQPQSILAGRMEAFSKAQKKNFMISSMADPKMSRVANALGKIGDPRALPVLERLASWNTYGTGYSGSIKAAREAAEKIRQRMAVSQKGTK